jgi:putative transposase
VSIETKHLSIRQKCQLLSVNRSRIYYVSQKSDVDDTTLRNEITDIYQRHPFMGYKRITHMLKDMHYEVNHKRIYRLKKEMGLTTLYPKINLSKRRQKDSIFPYLLKENTPLHVHDCWMVDITYIKMKKGFVYLTALIDVVSRCIMGWNVSTTLETDSCLKALNMALKSGFKPKIINSDQGCQFTSQDWVWTCVEHRIEISMDSVGRCLDNIFIERFWRTLKYEEVYLKTYDSVMEAKENLKRYIYWYNHERRHSSLNGDRPFHVMITENKTIGNENVENVHTFTHNFTPTTTTIKQLMNDMNYSSTFAA